MTAFSRRCITLLGLVCAGLPALGCGGGDGGSNEPPPSTTSIAKTAGDAQPGAVGQVLPEPLVVTVTDGDVASVGSTVTWSASGGGSVDPTSVVTDASGNASTTWTLGTTSGSQTAQATLTGASGSPVTFTASAVAGPATTLAEAGGNNQTGQINTALALPVQAKVTDEFGNGVAGVDVGWGAPRAPPAAPPGSSNRARHFAAARTLGGRPRPLTISS